jgi:serine/threonine-protein kinase
LADHGHTASASALTKPGTPGQLARRRTPRGSLTATPVTSPREALRLEEIHRARAFAGFVAVLSAIVAAALGAVGGDPVAKRVHLAGVAVGFASSLWLLWRLRDPAGYEPRHNVLFGAGCVVTVVSGYYFWGVYSAVLLVIPIGALFFALGASFYGSLGLVVAAVGAHAALAFASLFGAIADVGIVQPRVVHRIDLSGVTILVELICIAAFVMARGLRRSTLSTMEQLDGAVREIAQREALLNEAKQELERALEVGGPGRHTGMSIGSFKLGHLLGRGAMGDVYEAIHEQTGEPAAVKLLHANAAVKPELVARFRREVELAAKLRADNLVRVLEVSSPDAPLAYLAMERLEGQSLAELLRSTPRMPPGQVLALVEAVCAGIGVAHAAGVVHRDLKPRNVFRHWPDGGLPRWKILDFGVSKLVDRSGTLTRGHVVGTPSYMAPEQARSGEVDTRADLWAIGVIAYRALTGRPPFTGPDVPAILHAVVYEMPPRPSEVGAPGTSFDAVLAIAMAKPPHLRFATAAELAEAFGDAYAGRPSPALVRRANAILSNTPWGTRLRGA